MNNNDVLDLRWHGKLPENYGQVFDKIAYLIRKEFTELIAQVSSSLNNNLDWWVEGPASRNYFSSPLFHYCCSLVLLEKLEAEKNLPKLIFVDSRAFYNIIKTWINENEINLRIRQLSKIDESLTRKYFGGIFRPIKSSFKLLLQYLATRNSSEYEKLAKLSQPLILIDTFILDGFEVKDRYYPGLWENLKPKDKKRTYFVPEFEKNSISKILDTKNKLRFSEKNYIIKWELLSFKDYIHVVNHYFRIRKIEIPICNFRGFPLKKLIFEELFSGVNAGMAMKGILNYCFFQRLNQLGVKIETSINWFENQGIDKGWNRGLHDFFPETKKRGYLGMIISRHYLPMFPTRDEAKARVIPDTLFVVGKSLKESIKEFYPGLSVQTAPAFRFQGVYRKFQKQSVNSDLTVLITLYSVLEEAVSSIKFALATNFLLKNDFSIQWQFKPHYLTNKQKLLAAMDLSLPDNCTWLNKDFHESLDEVDILMSSASSTCMEAIARGKFVIIIGNPHSLTHNPIPSSVPKELWKLCYSPSEAADTLKRHNYEIYKPSSTSSIREAFFEPVTQKGVEQMIDT